MAREDWRCGHFGRIGGRHFRKMSAFIKKSRSLHLGPLDHSGEGGRHYHGCTHRMSEQKLNNEINLIGASCLRDARDAPTWRWVRAKSELPNGEHPHAVPERSAADTALFLEGRGHADVPNTVPGCTRNDTI
ncbi:hypothetical protein FB451DRAFT_1172968 [Mycena latifolia]|nr:hypothetical protein FB451DRAFT_1172968 [Mycena latifolia]